MAFDNSTRNRLQRLVADCRDLLTREFDGKLQELYGIYASEGRVLDLSKLAHLNDEKLRVATVLRERIEHLASGSGSSPAAVGEAVKRVLREQAFTVLNRFAALRMAEERGIIVESVGGGLNSKGFKTFSEVAYSGLGTAYERYRVFLRCMFDEMAVDLGVLFDRQSPFGLLFPRENALLELFELFNAPEVKPLWREDETVGWIYQYFNDPAERKKMREESAAPRNSRELAVRNQFFTPRYVVEFLTDNTLGRIWYEMTRGATSVKGRCRYLVRRPNEIFLQPGEMVPEQPKSGGLSQADLLKQPVHIPHRPLKDPRAILMLDPACGSMHFGLYAFDLFEVIYDEAWEIAKSDSVPAGADPSFSDFRLLVADFSSKEVFLREVPRLIVERNLHGIDIDPRCAQIAGLSLWLRAQKAWKSLGLKPAERPSIKRSNLVCAEPMPGEKEFLREFVEKEFPSEERGVFLPLLESIFDRMQLAGEAGSLLKIEEEIRSIVIESKKLWKKSSQLEQSKLFAELKVVKLKEFQIDHNAITDAQFWDTVENRIYDALRDYAQQAENDGGFQRRLFAEDAARGFAFIDLCRKRYDVVLMNPPFGLSQSDLYEYLNREYPNSFIDLLASFIVRGEKLAPSGFIGAITSRACLYTTTLLEWRKIHMSGRISALADMGIGVLDGAMVRASAYVIPVGLSNVNGGFIDARKEEDKASAILSSIQAAASGNADGASFYCCDSAFFALVPQHRILYWLPRNFWRQIRSLPTIEPRVATIRAGLTTYDDERFLRLRWEVDSNVIGVGKRWIFLSKGGYFSTFYNDVHLVILWMNEGNEVGAYNRSLYDTDAQSRRGSAYYLRPAVTYSRRTDYFSARALPENCFFSDKGPCVIPLNEKSPTYILGVFNADLFRGLVHAQSQGGCFETGVLKFLPWCEPSPDVRKRIETLAKTSWLAKANVFSMFETDARYISPILLRGDSIAACFAKSVHIIKQANATTAANAKMISSEVSQLFGLTSDNFEDLNVFESDHEIKEAAEFVEFSVALVTALVSHFVGCTFGRWDIRYATDEQAAPEVLDPFAPLPACAPSQLQNAHGLPVRPEDVPAAYPVRIPWAGILVDDLNHSLDIERRVREVIEIIWKDRAEAIEHEACEILGVKSLRDYFRKSADFFADHLKRYSKSRRQAPIYWPLSTASGSYTLWIYYHRLTDQTLFQCVNDFVKPKITEVESDLSRLTVGGVDKPGARAEFERLTTLRAELVDFRDELLRVAQLPYQPNLNDGVLITASPLWKLFRLPKWQKDLKACWTELEKGGYDWAHLALTLWPARVKAACKTDRSIAIAHGLEELCEVKASEKKAKSTKNVQMEMEE